MFNYLTNDISTLHFDISFCVIKQQRLSKMCKLQQTPAIGKQNFSPQNQDVLVHQHLQRDDDKAINKIVVRLAQIGDQITEDYQSVDVA